MNRTSRPILIRVLPILLVAWSAPPALAQCDGNWTQLNPGTSPALRESPALAYDSDRDVMVMFGGANTNYLNDTWEWDGATWSQKAPALAPSPREYISMCYDPISRRTILFGGESSGGVGNGDTWLWDGVNWTQSTAASPPPRWGNKLVYDSIRKVVVLFGGQYGGNYFNETWEWDGGHWNKVVTATSPSARSFVSLAYDSSRKVCVLFGGHHSSGDNNETWEFDGSNWTKKTPSSPSPGSRYGAAMVYDETEGACLLFGGYPPISDETWKWDGNEWTQLALATKPQPLWDPGMVHDTVGQRAFLFAGQTAASPYASAETWVWQSDQPHIFTQPNPLSKVAGEDATFSVTVLEVLTLSFQWRRDGLQLNDDSRVSGSTSATLSINPLSTEDAGLYDCVVANACGEKTSSSAALEVTPVDQPNPPAGNNCGACGMGSTPMIALALLSLVAATRRKT